MLFLCLAILSSFTISLIMRISTDRISANLSMLGVNYFVCALLGAAYAGFDLLCGDVPGFSTAVFLGAVSGVLYLGGFVLIQWNTANNGIVLTSIFTKLGLLVPTALSVLFFREMPTSAQISGFCIAVISIVLINFKSQKGGSHFRWPLVAMLLMCGASDAMSKIFEVFGSAALSDQFLFYTFAMAFLLCFAIVIYKKEHPGLGELLFGILIGIPNFFSAKFLLLALTELPAVVVFPSFSIATMLITTLTGVVFFRERLLKLQWLALAAIIVALFLLNI